MNKDDISFINKELKDLETYLSKRKKLSYRVMVEIGSHHVKYRSFEDNKFNLLRDLYSAMFFVIEHILKDYDYEFKDYFTETSRYIFFKEILQIKDDENQQNLRREDFSIYYVYGCHKGGIEFNAYTHILNTTNYLLSKKEPYEELARLFNEKYKYSLKALNRDCKNWIAEHNFPQITKE